MTTTRNSTDCNGVNVFTWSRFLRIAMTSVLFWAIPAGAATGGRHLVIGVLANPTISISITSAGGTFSSPGTAATTALGTFNRYGAAPTGFTIAGTSSDFTLSSTIGISVTKTNSTSTSYTLAASYTAPVSLIVWKLNAVTLTTTLGTIDAAAAYGSKSLAWTIAIDNAAAAQASFSKVITFSVVLN
jgi:hypothetical protein